MGYMVLIFKNYNCSGPNGTPIHHSKLYAKMFYTVKYKE